jgi:hypothetical protein
MPLPHHNQLLMTGAPGGPGTTPQEPVFLNLFEINFVLPTILSNQGRDTMLLLEQATNVTFDLSPEIDRAEQRFKYSTRKFIKTPTKTDVDFDITFNVNVNNSGAMETWNTLKAWYDLAWNSQTGALHYKADTIGTVIVNQHDKKGLVLRRVTFQNAQIFGLGTTELKWEANDIWSCNAKFVADYWFDDYIDNGVILTDPYISGY